MKNRYTEIMLEADKGINFEVSKGKNGKILIKAVWEQTQEVFDFPEIKAGEYADEISIYVDFDGNKAVIPPGWVVSGNESENTIWGKNLGLVIYNIPKTSLPKVNWENIEYLKETYSQLVWVPVSLLDKDGIFNEKSSSNFGRRDYQFDGFSESEIKDPFTEELKAQAESIKKYGGFYVLRYKVTESLLSVKGQNPLMDITFYHAKTKGVHFSLEKLETHLLYGAEYDTILAWFLKSGSKNMRGIVKTLNNKLQVVKTGTTDSINNIYDLENNGAEWTQEEYGTGYRTVRGERNLAYRSKNHPANSYKMVGFRYACFIK